MNEFNQAFAEIIEVDMNLLEASFSLVNSAAWDSLAFISTIALVDQFFGIVLESDALESVQNFGDLTQLIQQKAAA